MVIFQRLPQGQQAAANAGLDRAQRLVRGAGDRFAGICSNKPPPKTW
jgi:hypothetical protein